MNLKKLFYQYPAEIFLFLSTFFIRFPFFFRDYIDLDESTFILMGQSISDGHLPYDHIWDLKPPLLFYIFGLVEKLFPHSFIAIRFCGVIIIFLSALFLMKISRQAGFKNGFLIALGYIILSSEFGSLQGVMSEHFAVFFILLGLIFFLRKKSNYDLLIAGIAFGCAIMCKLNYAYPIALLLVFYFIYHWRKKNIVKTIGRTLLLVTGIILPVILLAMPFALSGKTNLFINSVFLAPWEYAKATDVGWLQKMKTSVWVIALTALVCFLSLRFASRENKNTVYISSTVLIGTVYTFFSSGIINGHYLVLIYPFLLLLLLGVIIQKTIKLKLSLAAIIVFLLSFESILEYYRLAKYFRDPSEYRPTFEVITELKKRKLDGDKIFFADYHIGYWLLHQYPLTKSSTHPSNLARPFLFKYFSDSNQTSLKELKYLMQDVKPDVIVTKTNYLDYFSENGPENKYFNGVVTKDFEKVYDDASRRIVIWQRVHQ